MSANRTKRLCRMHWQIWMPIRKHFVLYVNEEIAMLKKHFKLLSGVMGLIIAASACNMGQIVIQTTVVVTATLSTEQALTPVPTLVPTNTSLPPTVAPPPPPPPPPTKAPPPPPP